MAQIKVQSVRAKKGKKLKPKEEADKLHATLCYYYNAYTLSQARRLPYKDVVLLINVARKEQASEMYTLVQIAAAPYTQKRKGLKSLSEHLKKIMER